MAEIPEAGSFIGRDDDQGKFHHFFDFVTSAITRDINEHKLDLAAGKTIRFKLPVLRDMGESKQLWLEYFPIVLTHLAQRGWLAERDMEATEVELLISVPKELVESAQQNPPTYERFVKLITGKGGDSE